MWKNAVIGLDKSIKEALKIINDYAFRAVFVTDNEQRFLGIVTDGDVRRGLLNDISLDQEVGLIVNRNPVSCRLDEATPETIKKILKNNRFLHVPIIDEDDKLVDVRTYDDFLFSKKRDNPVFIMAGGFGTRLKPLTDNCPKPMLKIGDKPILEHILLRLIDQGFYRFYFSTHYLANIVMDYFKDGTKWGVSIEYIYEDTPLGTGGALSLLPKDIGDLPLVMMNGDVMTKTDFGRLVDYHNEKKGCATVAVLEYHHEVPFGVITTDGAYIVNMVEKPTHRSFVNAGMYVLEPSVYKSVSENHKIDMPTLLLEQINSGKKIASFPIHEYWLDVGRMDDFELAQKDVENGVF